MTPLIFDRRALRRRRDRAAAGFAKADFLMVEVGERIADRLLDVRRSFPMALDLGCHDGVLGRLLAGRGGIESLVQCDLSPAMLANTEGIRLAADEEALPFADGVFDLVLSNMSLHWVNDLPGTLSQIRRSLKPDGLFLGSLIGGASLSELRAALTVAETQTEGGLSPRISPFIDVKDAGDLLLRAGFALPVADADTLRLSHSDPLAVMADLRAMGESNVLHQRRKSFTRRATLQAACDHLRAEYGDEEGRIGTTFQIIYLLGWAPHPQQPKPIARGSGKVSLSKFLE